MSTLTGTAHNQSTLPGALPALTVMVEKDLEVLVHRFLARKRADLERARAALATGDFETIRRIGHDLKGAGEGFGFPELSAFGAALERAAVLHNERALDDELVAVDQFLSRLRITFK